MEITEELLNIQIIAIKKQIKELQELIIVNEYAEIIRFLTEKIRINEEKIRILEHQKGLLNDEKDAVEELNNMKIYITKKE